MSVKGRIVHESAETFQLPEPGASYKGNLGAEKGDIGAENTYFWNDFLEHSDR